MTAEIVSIVPRIFGEPERLMDHLLDWIYRFGLSTKEVMGNAFGDVDAAVRLLTLEGKIRNVFCESGGEIIVLTPQGRGQAASRYDDPFSSPEVEWQTCNIDRLQDLLWLQTITGENLRQGKIINFWTPRMLVSDEAYPFPDCEWERADGSLWAVNVDTGESFAWRHRLVVNISIRVGDRPNRYQKELLILNHADLVHDYHERMIPGKKIPVWDDKDFEPSAYVEVPDVRKQMIVALVGEGGGYLS